MTRATDRRKRLEWALKMTEIHGTPFLAPATLREILAHEAKAPMRAGNEELGHTSLWGDSHKQAELFG